MTAEQNRAQTTEIPASVRRLAWGSFFTDFASEIMYPLVPMFLTTVLGASLGFVGFYEGLSEAAAQISKYFFGKMSDKRPEAGKKMVAIGYFVANGLRPFIALAGTPAIALTIRFFDRLGKGLRSPARDRWIANSAPDHERGRMFGHQRAMDHLGAAIGPLFATAYLLWRPGDLSTLFLLTIIPGLIAVGFVVAAPFAEGRTAPAKPHHEAPVIVQAPPAARRALKWYLGALFIFALGNSTDAFLLLALQREGLPIAWIPIAWCAIHLVKSSGSKICGPLADRMSKTRLIQLGWVVQILVYGVFASGASLPVKIGLFVFYGIHYALTESADKTLIASLVHPSDRGRIYGLSSLITGLALLIANVVGGWLGDRFGLGATFALGCSTAALAIVVLTLAPRIKGN